MEVADKKRGFDMVRIWNVVHKKTGTIDTFRFKQNAEAKLAQYREMGYGGIDNLYIESQDVQISDFPEWSWFWDYNTPEREYRASILCIIDQDED